MNPFDRLDRAIAEGLVVRDARAGKDEQGRNTACILSTMCPECEPRYVFSRFPCDILPRWMVFIVVWIDLYVSDEKLPTMTSRFAAVIRHWKWTPEDRNLSRLHFRIRMAAIEESLHHTNDPETVFICNRALRGCQSLHDGIDSNDVPKAYSTSRFVAASRKCPADSWAACVAWDSLGGCDVFTAFCVSMSYHAAESAGHSAAEAADRLCDKILTALEDERNG